MSVKNIFAAYPATKKSNAISYCIALFNRYIIKSAEKLWSKFVQKFTQLVERAEDHIFNVRNSQMNTSAISITSITRLHHYENIPLSSKGHLLRLLAFASQFLVSFCFPHLSLKLQQG